MVQQLLSGHEVNPAIVAAVPDPDVLDFLLALSPQYPGIDEWYRRRVLPGVGENSRCLVVHRRGGKIVAVGIGKDDQIEQKICTVRVAPDYQGRGIGVRICERVLS